MLLSEPNTIAAYCDPSELPTSGQLLNLAMRRLAADPKAIFLGQSVAYPGWAHGSLDGVPMEQRLEMPVAEELQLGISTGLALTGHLPISIFPRFDFLLLAMSQLVLHLDKLPLMSGGDYQPKVIIRTRVGSRKPLDAGPQHTGDFTSSVASMLTTVQVRRITRLADILPTYQAALDSEWSSLIVEAL
jgi:pyruvate/2-oxoglutarate/acetoin dehydrogenase E1 component